MFILIFHLLIFGKDVHTYIIYEESIEKKIIYVFNLKQFNHYFRLERLGVI